MSGVDPSANSKLERTDPNQSENTVHEGKIAQYDHRGNEERSRNTNDDQRDENKQILIRIDEEKVRENCKDEYRAEEQNQPQKQEPNGPKKRTVRFGSGDKLVTAIFEPKSPFSDAEPLGPYELVGVYKIRCDTDGLRPLYSVIAQLKNINLKESFDRRELFTLKGTQLTIPHVETLEEVFKHVRFEYVDLENCNLNDESVSSICEMIEFYASATEICLARNPQIKEEGWKAIAHLIHESPFLRWIDVRGITMTEADVHALGNALRIQAVSCRTEFRKFMRYEMSCKSLEEKELSPDKPDEEEMAAATRLAKCSSHGTVKCPVCLSSPPCRGVKGVHMGGTELNDILLSSMVNNIRLSAISDLRLTDNKLVASDAVFLIPLLRFSSPIRLLDLSRNQLGDEGCKVLSNALCNSALSGESLANVSVRLRRLYLAENGLTESCMTVLGYAVSRCPFLSCLQLSDNPLIKCPGVLNLQPGLFQCRKLKRLGLANCGIECVGTIALAELLVDKPRDLAQIDLRGNTLDPAGLIALSRCLKCVDRRVQIFYHQNPRRFRVSESSKDSIEEDGLLQMIARYATGGSPSRSSSTDRSPNTHRNSSPPSQNLHMEAWQIFDHTSRENLMRFGEPEKKPYNRYCHVRCPAGPPNKSSDANQQQQLRDAADEDPRYLWGDSTDEEDTDERPSPASNDNSPETMKPVHSHGDSPSLQSAPSSSEQTTSSEQRTHSFAENTSETAYPRSAASRLAPVPNAVEKGSSCELH
ncbi:unnamed protein product [Calicophoron daubneyi]|uniref:Uncharacterized protein n=1 Tax=Calicophoron daubneyi TaxID=300641 RepID=A0AAV2TC81_CALDB